MSPHIPIALVVFLLLMCAVLVVLFNRLVRDKNLMQEAWSGIDVQLKRRHNLIPGLVEVVEGYSAHEKNVLERVTRARSESINAKQPKDRETSENVLSQTLKTLFAVAEAYPDLKADRAYLELQNQLTEVEDQIQLARRYYNGTVRNYNIRVESFPSNLVARVLGFGTAEFFQLETATEREVPEVEM